MMSRFGSSRTVDSGGWVKACPVVDCIQDLSNVCPSTLVAKNKAGWAVGCFSPCDAFKDPKYCCTGSYTGPQCLPNEYRDLQAVVQPSPCLSG
ncbi:hypothetical protein CK203_009396 [Vitis vinifera]|uniref:Thaumatin-like protein n=1 Tax=Vitis vinifera TaxID=29760 RepID=A0A438JSR7_VITVI|nr:hypothetical protein CK203_009396 [Vitis vinifera]